MRRTQSLHSINYDSTNSSVYQSRDSVDVLQKSIYDSLCPCKIMARQIFGQLVSCMFEMSLKKLCLHVLSSGSHLSNTKHPACSACHRILVPSTTCLKHSETRFVITYLRLKLKVMGKSTFFGGNSEKNSRDSTLLHSLIVRDHAPCNTAMYSGSKTTTNIYKDGCHRYFTVILLVDRVL